MDITEIMVLQQYPEQDTIWQVFVTCIASATFWVGTHLSILSCSNILPSSPVIILYAELTLATQRNGIYTGCRRDHAVFLCNYCGRRHNIWDRSRWTSPRKSGIEVTAFSYGRVAKNNCEQASGQPEVLQTLQISGATDASLASLTPASTPSNPNSQCSDSPPRTIFFQRKC